MAISLAEIKTRVKTEIRADSATPSISDLHDNSIAQWANEHTADVINLLPEPALHFKDLLNINTALTFSSGSVAYPANYQRAVAVKVSGSYTDDGGSSVTVTDRKCKILTVDRFAPLDSSNFVVTPTLKRPVAMLAEKIYVKPTSVTSGKLDWIKSHPTIDGSNGTKFDDEGDNALILHILKRYYMFIEEEGRAALKQQEIDRMGGINANQ